MTAPQAAYRLSRHGRSLWVRYTEITKIECDEKTITRKLMTDPVAISGKCGWCGTEDCIVLVVGLFCVPCMDGAFEKI